MEKLRDSVNTCFATGPRGKNIYILMSVFIASGLPAERHLFRYNRFQQSEGKPPTKIQMLVIEMQADMHG